MDIERDQDEAIEFTWKFYIKSIFGFVYLNEVKRDNDKIVKINF